MRPVLHTRMALAAICAVASCGGLCAQQTLYEVSSGGWTGSVSSKIYEGGGSSSCFGPISSFPPAQLNNTAGSNFGGDCNRTVTDSPDPSSAVQKSENVSFSVPNPDPGYTSWSMSGQATHSLNAGSIAASATVSSASPGPPDTGAGVNTRTEALVANAGTAGKPPQFWLTGAVSQFQTCSAYIVVSGANYTWIYSAAARMDGTWGYTSSSSQTQANGPGTISGTTILAQPDLSQDGPYTAYVELDVDSSLGAGTAACSISWNVYVALGDSFAAGAGDPNYGPTQADINCYRSLYGFPIRMNLNEGLVFAACSGAQTTDLTTTPEPHTAQKTAQLDFIGTDQSPSSDVSLVTVMIGGNDSGLFPYFEYCYLENLVTGVCSSAIPPLLNPNHYTIATQLTYLLAQLHNSLVNVYHEIHSRAPNARVVAPLYPNPFPSGGPQCSWLSGVNQKFLSSAVDDVNDVIRVAAGQSGVEVVDLNSVDNSHFPSQGLCSGDSWFVVPPALQNVNTIIHPNSRGEAEMARILGDYLAGTAAPLNPLQNPQTTMQQGQTYTATTKVSANQGSATFSSSWPGSTITMTLVSPSGHVITSSTTSSLISHDIGPTFENYTILLPEAGTWTVVFYGLDVASSGEPLSYAFTTLPRYPGDADGDGVATCNDLAIVKAAFGTSSSGPFAFAFDPRPDLNNDGVVNVLDLSLVAKNLLTGTTCQ